MTSLRKFFAALISSMIVGGASAQTEVDRSALLGKWKVIEQHPSGAALVTTVQFDQDSHFTTSTTVNGNLYMSASGTWKVSGKSLVWRYETSSNPAVQSGYVDTDEIASVGSRELSLVSKLSGKPHIYQRF